MTKFKSEEAASLAFIALGKLTLEDIFVKCTTCGEIDKDKMIAAITELYSAAFYQKGW